MKMSTLKLLVAAVMAGVLVSGQSQAQQIEIKFGHVGAPGSLFEISALEFAKRANAKLGDKVKVVVYGASQLGDDREMMRKLLLGTQDISLPSTVMTSIVDEFGIFEMPYLVKDRDHMKRIEKEIVWPKLSPLAEKKGYKVLAVWENGFRHITNNKRPIVVPEDLKDIKLRTPQGKWRVKMFQAYGANPTAMAFSEVFTALQTGTMDGQKNPFVQIYSGKFQEVQKYLSLTGHVYTPAFPTMSLKKFQSLPADVQNVLVQEAMATQDFIYREAARLDNELLDKIKAAGTKVNEANKDAFVKASGAIYKEFGETVKGASDLIEIANRLR